MEATASESSSTPLFDMLDDEVLLQMIIHDASAATILTMARTCHHLFRLLQERLLSPKLFALQESLMTKLNAAYGISLQSLNKVVDAKWDGLTELHLQYWKPEQRLHLDEVRLIAQWCMPGRPLAGLRSLKLSTYCTLPVRELLDEKASSPPAVPSAVVSTRLPIARSDRRRLQAEAAAVEAAAVDAAAVEAAAEGARSESLIRDAAGKIVTLNYSTARITITDIELLCIAVWAAAGALQHVEQVEFASGRISTAHWPKFDPIIGVTKAGLQALAKRWPVQKRFFALCKGEVCVCISCTINE